MTYTWEDIDDILTGYEDQEGARVCVQNIRNALWNLPEAGEYRRIRLQGYRKGAINEI